MQKWKIQITWANKSGAQAIVISIMTFIIIIAIAMSHGAALLLDVVFVLVGSYLGEMVMVHSASVFSK